MSRRRWSWRYLLLFLAAALLPWKLAQACSQQDCMTENTCCCTDAVALCPLNACGSAVGCCLITAGPFPAADKPHAISPRSGGDPPVPCATQLAVPMSLPAVHGPPDRRRTSLASNSDLYLRTNRLRL